MKRCPKCGQEKPESEYNKASGRKDGLQSKCKSCFADYRERNREKVRQSVRDCWAKYGHRYIEKCRLRSNQWKKDNKEKHALHERRRRAMKFSAVGDHTAEQVFGLKVRQKNKCAICRSSLSGGYHADHIFPLCLGGSNDISNIQLLCAPCNLRKGRKDPVAFMQSMGLLL